MKAGYFIFRGIQRARTLSELLLGNLTVLFYKNAFNLKIGGHSKFYGPPIISATPTSKIEIGFNCRIRSTCTGNAIGVNHKAIIRAMTNQATILLGNNFAMSGGAICAKGRIEIGSNVMIGANCVISDSDFHPIKTETGNEEIDTLVKPVIIGSNVWIGANTYILKGSSIGDGCTIGANSVVSGTIPPNSIAAGVPARVIRKSNEKR